MACKICDHPKRLEIERDIPNLSLREVVAKYGGFSISTVTKHKRECIPKAIAASKNGKKILKFQTEQTEIQEIQSINLVSDLLALRNTVTRILDNFRNMEEDLAALDDSEMRIKYGVGVKDAILRAVDRMVKVLDLYARVQGEIEGEKHLHIHQSPEAIEFVQNVYKALRPYPEALAAVTRVMDGVTA